MTKEEKRIYDREYYRINKKKIIQSSTKWKKANPDKVRVYSKKWNSMRSRNVKGIFYNLKRNSTKKHREFNLTQDEFSKWYTSQERVCQYCGFIEKLS